MNNIFSQKIGIWYKDEEWLNEMRKKVLEVIPVDSIRYIRNLGKEICLKDGSLIRFVKSTDSVRGCAFTRSYIQHGIPKEVYLSIIEPCTKPIFSKSIVVDKFEDFAGWLQANDTYWDKEIR